jgi:hypothetical protein
MTDGQTTDRQTRTDGQTDRQTDRQTQFFRCLDRRVELRSYVGVMRVVTEHNISS